MVTGAPGREQKMRNQVVSLGGIAYDFVTATAASGAATANGMAGSITSEALSTAFGATYTLTLTNSAIAVGDFILPSLDPLTSTGTPAIANCKISAGQVVIVVQNIHASVALNAAIQINFVVVKKLTPGPGGQP